MALGIVYIYIIYYSYYYIALAFVVNIVQFGSSGATT